MYMNIQHYPNVYKYKHFPMFTTLIQQKNQNKFI